MSKQPPKTPQTPDAGIYSRNGNSAAPENRFAEVQRKSAAARAKLNVASQERARTEDQRAADDRRDFAERDRLIDRDRPPAPVAPSPLEKASAQLDAAGEEPPGIDEDGR
jgi:hypothetical protein